jgi:predicted RNA-binding protein with PIN domain
VTARPDGADVGIEPRDLRSAIEFAVAIAEEANRGRRSLAFPAELRAHFGTARIPTGALGRLRRAVEADDAFRTLIGQVAVTEFVDPIGMLWLQRPAGWEDEVRRLLAARADEAEEVDLRRALKRAEKRREAAELVARRGQAALAGHLATIDALRAELDTLRADLAKADDAVGELRTELIDVRNEARHARDRESALRSRLDAATAAASAASRSGADGPAATEPSPAAPADAIDRTELGAIARSVRDLGERLDALARPSDDRGSFGAAPQRRPLRLPGGLIASSAAAAEFLLRSDAAVLVDGYNVAKLGWPTERLDEQRRRLLDGLENVARRFGADVTVVFDGTTVVGAHADRRRMVRVAFSPEGVTADDVLRDEVHRLPAGRPVVVVTNDAEIVDDVRAHGANVVPSNALLAVL